MAEQQQYLLVRERNLILALLLGLSAVGWVILVWQGMARSGTAMGLTMGMGVFVFLAIWVAMMSAMMFPSASPMILMFAAVSAGKRRQARAFVPTWIFVSGYLLVWTLFGALAYVAATAVDHVAARVPWLMDNGGRIGGLVLIIAGLYQLTPLKNVCLGKCQTPTQFVMTSWRDGYGGAVRMGIEHGVYCLGCCWALMAILFPLGMMNIVALGLVAAFVFAEKVLPIGRMLSKIAAVALIGYGLAAVITPAVLPTMMS